MWKNGSENLRLAWLSDHTDPWGCMGLSSLENLARFSTGGCWWPCSWHKQQWGPQLGPSMPSCLSHIHGSVQALKYFLPSALAHLHHTLCLSTLKTEMCAKPLKKAEPWYDSLAMEWDYGCRMSCKWLSSLMLTPALKHGGSEPVKSVFRFQ